MIVFDLDDTLLWNGKVPRQTYHVLRNLNAAGHEIVIISSNLSAAVWVALRKLGQFVSSLYVPSHTGMTRADLMGLALSGARAPTPVFYFDDRLDNLDAVKKVFDSVTCVHVHDLLDLQVFVKAVVLGTGTLPGECSSDTSL
jgi:hypothetical protein